MPAPMPTAPNGVDVTQWAYAIGQIRGYCEWHIGPEFTETIKVDGPGGHLLALPTMRLVDLDSISSDGATVSSPEWSQAGLVKGRCWSSKLRGIEVTMTHGYEVWPDDLEALALDIIGAATRAGVKAVTSGSHQVSFESSLTSAQRSTLERYKLRGLP